jgi:transcriptional regulator
MAMYSPPAFKLNDSEAAFELMRRHAFATVVTVVDGAPFVSHLPVLVEREASSGELVLLGHLARANPHWRHFGAAGAASGAARSSGGTGTGSSPDVSETLFIFHGPHTYVTPSWYADPDNVPTWNYAVVHAYGMPELVDDYEGLHAILKRTVDELESREPRPWQLESIPEEFKQDLARGIVGFRAKVVRLDAKFKLSQNRADADRLGVIEGLRGRTDDQSRGVLALME